MGKGGDVVITNGMFDFAIGFVVGIIFMLLAEWIGGGFEQPNDHHVKLGYAHYNSTTGACEWISLTELVARDSAARVKKSE